MNINRIDHLVLTVTNIQTTCDFYSRVLGMEVVTFGEGRQALHLGQQKINLHEVGKEFEPKAKSPISGAGDLCFITDVQLSDVIRHLEECKIIIEEGPVTRTGALGAITSVYV